MDAVTVICDICGEHAIVHRLRYKYIEDGAVPVAESHVLREIQRDIECPHCGMRTQIENV